MIGLCTCYFDGSDRCLFSDRVFDSIENGQIALRSDPDFIRTLKIIFAADPSAKIEFVKLNTRLRGYQQITYGAHVKYVDVKEFHNASAHL